MKKFVTLLAKRLELRGFKVSFTNTGIDAVNWVKKGKKFDIAVLDVKMPGIGGIELQRQLQYLDQNMKFIFLTGHGSDIDDTVRDKHATLYLSKPIKIDSFIETLFEVSKNE